MDVKIPEINIEELPTLTMIKSLMKQNEIMLEIIAKNNEHIRDLSNFPFYKATTPREGHP